MANNDVIPWLIPAHAAVATVAAILGAYNLIRRPKGDRRHRRVGLVWMTAMYATVLSSFAIRELNPGHFTWIHGLSVFTFVTLTIALWCAVTGRIAQHRNFVIGSYCGLIGAFIGAVVVPVRYLPQTITHRPAEVALGLLGCVAVAVAVIRLSRERHRTPSDPAATSPAERISR
jgi:uncharacterized membrane protein